MKEPSNQMQKLFAAIQKSDVELFKQLLASGIDLEQKDANGQTALTLASSIGNSEIIHLLISAGATINLEPEPLVFNPQIGSTELPGGQNIGDLIAQATAEAPEEAKKFYAGFMSVMDALSKDDEIDNEATKKEQLIEDDDYSEEGDDEDYEDSDESSASTPIGALEQQ